MENDINDKTNMKKGIPALVVLVIIVLIIIANYLGVFLEKPSGLYSNLDGTENFEFKGLRVTVSTPVFNGQYWYRIEEYGTITLFGGPPLGIFYRNDTNQIIYSNGRVLNNR